MGAAVGIDATRYFEGVFPILKFSLELTDFANSVSLAKFSVQYGAAKAEL